MLQVMGNALTGFINARGTGAQHDGNTIAAESSDCLLNIALYLQCGFEQQSVVAAVLLFEPSGDRCQFAAYRADGRRAFRHPAALPLHARAVTGKQFARHFGGASAQRADHAQCVEVSSHGAASSGLIV